MTRESLCVDGLFDRDGSFAFSFSTLKRETKATFSPSVVDLLEKEQVDASW